jgi:hypothetical protein
VFSYRLIVVSCAVQLVTALAPVGARAQGSPPSERQSAPSASFEDPPSLEGDSAAGAPPATVAPATAAPATDLPATDPAPPDSAPAGPSPCPEALGPPSTRNEAIPPPGEDPDGVFRAFAVFAASERDRRIVGTVAGVVAGVTTIALGALIAEPTGTDADVWYVIGGIAVGTSLLGLLLPSPAESLARSYRVREIGHSASDARSLEIKWNDYALASKRRRITGGALSLASSAFFVGAGIAIATGAGDFTQGDQEFWGSFLIATGATMAVSGAANLFVKSSAERSLEAYRAVRPEPVALRPVLMAGPAGLLAGAYGTF